VHDPHEEPKKPASHHTAVFILIAMVVTIAWFGWQTLRTHTLTITSVSKPGTYVLEASRPRPSSRRVHVTGWIDGRADLQVGSDAAVSVGPGTVEWKTAGDWVEGDLVLKYTPRGTTLGKLTVDYRID
jgi:hypothetical protein